MRPVIFKKYWNSVNVEILTARAGITGGRFDDTRDETPRHSRDFHPCHLLLDSYLSANDPSDTLLRAYRNRDSSILVISGDDGLFANVFHSGRGFRKEDSFLTRTD